DPDEEGIGGVVFELQGPRQQFATSTDDGTFAFSHLPPGDYTLVVNPASLPPDVHMEGSSPIKITLRPGASIVLNVPVPGKPIIDRKSTRLNSSHVSISYAVFCLKKKSSLEGKHKSYCTPEAYRGETCWFFRNHAE